MSEFTNVTVKREANVFFNGGVTSRTITSSDGSRKSLGIAQPGEFTFTTDGAEVMEILSGQLEVKVGEGAWRQVKGGEAFDVPPNTTFIMKVSTIVDYCCSFLS
jgi:uncharacterized protein YaiE (UPF0345 family)